MTPAPALSSFACADLLIYLTNLLFSVLVVLVVGRLLGLLLLGVYVLNGLLVLVALLVLQLIE